MNHFSTDALLDAPQVCRRAGASRPITRTSYRGIKQALYPRPIHIMPKASRMIGPNSLAWTENEINEWLASRPAPSWGTPNRKVLTEAAP